MFNRCRHIKSDGVPCGSPGVKGKPYCFFHMKVDGIRHIPSTPISPVEDSTSILLAVGQVIHALSSEPITPKNAGLMLYGLQIASSVVKKREQADPADTVRSLYNLAGAELDFHEAYLSGATMVAPETAVCEPPHDCAACSQNETCKKPGAAVQRKGFDTLKAAINDPTLTIEEAKTLAFGYLKYVERRNDAGKPIPLPLGAPKPALSEVEASSHPVTGDGSDT